MRLNYLAGQNQENIATNDHVSYQILSEFIYSCDSVIYRKTDSTVNTLYYLNWNSFILIGRSKINIRQTRNTIFAFTKPERQTILHNRLFIEALTFNRLAAASNLFARLLRVRPTEASILSRF